VARHKPVTRTASDLKDAFRSDPDFLKTVVAEVLDQVLEAEMTDTLGAEESERSPTCAGHRSGYDTRSLTNCVGKIELRVPQDRAGCFST